MKIEVKRASFKPPTFGELKPTDTYKYGADFYMKLKKDISDPKNTRNAVCFSDGCRWTFQDDDPVEVYEATLILK